jgi:amidase
MALGCDQGGSIRIPAAWSGVVGLKPTHGLVPYTGICALEASIDHVGPMGANVESVARLLTVIAGPDGLDPRQAATIPEVDYLGVLRDGLRGLRIGLMTQGFGRPESDPDTDSAVRAALARMQAVGADIEEVSVPAHEEMFDIWNAICVEGTAALMFGAGTGGYVEGHVSMPLLDAFAQGWRSRPEALSPSALMTLLMGDHVQHRYYGRYYAKAQALRGAVRTAYTKAFGQCDLLAMPTVPFPALPMPPSQATFAEMLAVALPMIGNTAALNASGHPAISVPVALRNGLPVGMMLVGRHFQDAVTLRAAAGLEALGDWQTW